MLCPLQSTIHNGRKVENLEKTQENTRRTCETHAQTITWAQECFWRNLEALIQKHVKCCPAHRWVRGEMYVSSAHRSAKSRIWSQFSSPEVNLSLKNQRRTVSLLSSLKSQARNIGEKCITDHWRVSREESGRSVSEQLTDELGNRGVGVFRLLEGQEKNI